MEQDWERLWAPYDEPTYQAVLAHVRADDVVLDIGAGDLRLACRLAERARRVYAIESQFSLMMQALARRLPLGQMPANVYAVCADARCFPFPSDVTLGVLLMRHCTHFQLYAAKLAQAGCTRLITNARWRLGVELVNLTTPRIPFGEITLGWYACRCGATGFRPGPPQLLTPAVEAAMYEVSDCPQCRQTGFDTRPV